MDTNTWIADMREGEPGLQNLLLDGFVVTHPLVIEELAAGNLPKRKEFLRLLSNLETLKPVTHREYLAFVEVRSLSGHGLGAVDLHLLASLVISPGVALWTKDARLNLAATGLGVTCL